MAAKDLSDYVEMLLMFSSGSSGDGEKVKTKRKLSSGQDSTKWIERGKSLNQKQYKKSRIFKFIAARCYVL